MSEPESTEIQAEEPPKRTRRKRVVPDEEPAGAELSAEGETDAAPIWLEDAPAPARRKRTLPEDGGQEEPGFSTPDSLPRTSEGEVPFEFSLREEPLHQPATSIPHHPESWPAEPKPEFQFVPVTYTPEPVEESARQSGLAYTMGIVFVASVAFMLLLGWGADLLLGSSPWGIVGGIVLGSIIGFVQFFRISSRIYKKPESEHRSLIDPRDP